MDAGHVSNIYSSADCTCISKLGFRSYGIQAILALFNRLSLHSRVGHRFGYYEKSQPQEQDDL